MLLTGYCLGIAVVSLFPVLDRSLFTLSLSLLLCAAIATVEIQSLLLRYLLLGLTIGVVWHWLWAVQQLENRLLPLWEGEGVIVQGQVVGLPVDTAQGQRFRIAIHSAQPMTLQGQLQLNTFPGAQQIQVAAGELWRLRVRLKQVHGYSNPGNFDQEGLLFRQGVIATGYVRESGENKRLAINSWSISWLRQRLFNNLKAQFEKTHIASAKQGMMLALIMGERSALSAENWRLFSATGTTHLFVISGLHVGLISLLGFRLANPVFRCLLALPLIRVRCYPAPSFAAVFACVLCLVYSLLAGWTLPTQRACIMVTVFLSSYVSKRHISLSLRYLFALSLVLSLDPLAFTSAGFWLSFVAVGVLLFFSLPMEKNSGAVGARDLNRCVRSGWQTFLRPQWLIFIGLFLPLSFWIGQVSLLAPLVNVLAIPLVGLVIVPLLLLGTIGTFIGEWVATPWFLFSEVGLSYLFSFLEFVSSNTASWNTLALSPPQTWQLLFILPGVFLLLMPLRFPYRWLALPLCLPLLVRADQESQNEQLRMDVFDVGQGLAVLIRTASHNLLFDTGPGNDEDWNAGDALLVPALKHSGVQNLSMIIVSHSDNDHAGGFNSIREAFPQAQLLVGESLPGVKAKKCRKGQAWEWDGVVFDILHPQEEMQSANNNSCVLRIQAGEHGILLPGDIDASVEKQLVADYGSGLASTVLVAAHHGSATSSSFPLLKMVNASQVVFANGYLNSFGHPASAILMRHHLFGSELYETAHTGMLSFRFNLADPLPQVSGFRQRNRHYWSWSENPRPCRYC